MRFQHSQQQPRIACRLGHMKLALMLGAVIETQGQLHGCGHQPDIGQALAQAL